MNEQGADLMQRYFHGDLDSIERAQLERKLAKDPNFRTRFDEAYDRRTEAFGFGALLPPTAEMQECFSPETLARYQQGKLSPEEEKMVEEHLSCPLCKAQLVDPSTESNHPRHRRRFWARRGLGLGGMAVAAAAAWMVLIRPVEPVFQERGLASPEQAWMRVQTLDLESGAPSLVHSLRPLGTSLSRSLELVFSVSTSQSSPYRHLAIASLDAKGRAHWYYPAYEHIDEDPMSVDIGAGWGDRALGHRISLDRHADGPLQICAMFTRHPLRVKDVDVQLEAEGQWPAMAHLDCVNVELTAP